MIRRETRIYYAESAVDWKRMGQSQKIPRFWSKWKWNHKKRFYWREFITHLRESDHNWMWFLCIAFNSHAVAMSVEEHTSFGPVVQVFNAGLSKVFKQKPKPTTVFSRTFMPKWKFWNIFLGFSFFLVKFGHIGGATHICSDQLMLFSKRQPRSFK